MTSNEVNPAKGCAGWLKGLFAGIFALVAAGSGLVAILQYMNPPASEAPPSNPVVVTVIAGEPVSNPSSQSEITPEQWQAVEDFLRRS